MPDSADPASPPEHSIYDQRARGERPLGRAGHRRVRRMRRTLARRVALAVTVLAFCYAGGTLAWLAMRHGWLARLWDPARREPPPPAEAPSSEAPPSPAADGGSETRLLGAIDRLQNRQTRNRDIVRETGRLASRGLIEEATALLRRELEADPKSLVLQEEMAGLDLAAGRVAAAQDGFLNVLAYAPDRTSAREGLAEACLRLGHNAAALAAAQWLLQDDPDRMAALRIAARVSVEVGQYPAAAQHLRRWLERDPGSVEARDLLGLCYLRLGEYGKAAFYLQKLARDGDGTVATFLNLALVFAQQKQSDDVISVLGEASHRYSAKTVVDWFGRPDFAALHSDARVMAFVTQLITEASPALSLRLPERSSTIVTGPMMGTLPRPDLILSRER